MNYKEEFIKRIKYLNSNAMFLINPDKHDDLVCLYNKIESNNKELLINLELLLLSDQKIESNPLYQDVLLKQKDKKYLLYLKDNKDKIIDVFTILCLVRRFIINNQVDKEVLIKKLEALDEYFKVMGYQNNGVTYQSGFIDYLSNGINWNSDNLCVLTEKEKQEMYLLFHDETAWDTQVKCEPSDLFFSDNYCNRDFYLREDELLYYNDNYYMMCPNCYNLVIINKKLIPDKIKEKIKKEALNDGYYLRNIFYKREHLVYEKKKLLK